MLAVVRHACSTNWDTLETWANHHELVRRVMGVHESNPAYKKLRNTHSAVESNINMLEPAYRSGIIASTDVWIRDCMVVKDMWD